MDKKVLLLPIAVIIAVILRLWNFEASGVLVSTDFLFTIPDSVLSPFFTNAFAPFYPYLIRFLSFPYIENVLPYLSIIFDVISVILIYFCMLEIKTKNQSKYIALIAAFFVAISTILIYYSQRFSEYSFVFLMGTLLLLFSLKTLNNKKNFIGITITSLLLFLTNSISLFFILFNIAALFLFAQKKKRNIVTIMCALFCMVVLVLPLLPFITTAIEAPEYIKKYALRLNFKEITIYLINMFSPQLNIGGTYKIQSFGSWLFVITPTLACTFLCLKAWLSFKAETNYITTTAFCTFLSVVILCTFTSNTFLSKYLLTIYPFLIALTSYGLFSLKSVSLKITLATVFVTTTLFYQIATNALNIKLF